MFSAAQNSASTATTFLTGYGCANNNTNATTSSSSSSRTRAFFSTKRQTPKRIIIANVGKATASNVSRNPNMGQLQAGYLFPEIARIRNAHLEKNPDAKIISLGIGDTTEPIPAPIVSYGKCGVGVRHGRWVRKDRRVRL